MGFFMLTQIKRRQMSACVGAFTESFLQRLFALKLVDTKSILASHKQLVLDPRLTS